MTLGRVTTSNAVVPTTVPVRAVPIGRWQGEYGRRWGREQCANPAWPPRTPRQAGLVGGRRLLDPHPDAESMSHHHSWGRDGTAATRTKAHRCLHAGREVPAA